jgi:hypothetical protein
MKTVRRTRKEFCKIVQRWRSSGMSRVEFCTQEKIHLDTFAGWIKKERDESAVAQKLVPLQIEARPEIHNCGFEIEYPNGVRLHLATLPSTEDLSRMVHLYREPCFR